MLAGVEPTPPGAGMLPRACIRRLAFPSNALRRMILWERVPPPLPSMVGVSQCELVKAPGIQGLVSGDPSNVVVGFSQYIYAVNSVNDVRRRGLRYTLDNFR